jgi:uncharacterized protein YbjT (DUF2867 family)
VLGVSVVTAAGGPTGTAAVRELRARGLRVRAEVDHRRPRLGRPPRTFAEHLADVPLQDAA